MNLNDFIKNPPSEFAPMPLWVWNDEISHKSIEFQLSELKSAGFGGAFVHPRPGLITEYLSEDWFSLWSHALKVAQKLGLILNIYDENSFPSGFAGGHVSSALPDCLATSAKYEIYTKSELEHQINKQLGLFVDDNLKNRLIKAYSCSKIDRELKLEEDISDIPFAQWIDQGELFFIIELEPAETRPWMGGFAYVDLLRPEVTQHFLQCTYQLYADKFGDDFGKTIQSIFSDEPYMTGSRLYSSGMEKRMPFSYWFADQFRSAYGYDLLDYLPTLFLDVNANWFSILPTQARFDYHTLTRKLWTENFIKPIYNWCQNNNIAWTGHFMEHEWPLPTGSPSIMQNYIYQHWPGIDVLQADLFLEEKTNPMLLTLLEIRSVANQFEKNRTICEAFGAGGWDSTFDDYKRITDWLIVNGINLINPHLTYGSIAGSRKRDHPQSFDWRAAWWKTSMVEYNRYVSRFSALASQGRMHQRILVLHPTETAYLTPHTSATGDLMKRIVASSPSMESYVTLLDQLTRDQWDFDLGDEGIIEEYASLEGEKINLGRQQYDVLILSSDMKSMRQSTIDIINSFAENGGTVLATEQLSLIVDGNTPVTLSKKVIILNGYDSLYNKLLHRLHQRITTKEKFPLGLTHMRRELKTGEILYFFTNHTQTDVNLDIALVGQSVSEINLSTGEISSVPILEKSNQVEFLLSIEASAAKAFIVSQKHNTADFNYKKTTLSQTYALDNPIITADSKNVLTLDYCTAVIDGKEYPDNYIFSLANRLFRARGFMGNPWEDAVQYKDRIISRNRFSVGSGFKLIYKFDVASQFIPKDILFAIERANFYDLKINGNDTSWNSSKQWIDPIYGLADISRFVVEGENTIQLTAKSFDIRLELEQAFIVGDFCLEIKKHQWCIEGKKKLGLGYWNNQGYPFYSDSVSYTSTLELETDGEIVIKRPNYSGTACVIYVDKQLHFDSSISDETARTILLDKGEHEITAVVYGSAKNKFGPHHAQSNPRREGWPKLWKQAPTTRQPNAEDYDFIEYGLLESLKYQLKG